MTDLAIAARQRLPLPKAVHVRPTVPCPLCGSPMHAQQPLESLREVSLGGNCGYVLKRLVEVYPNGVRRTALEAELYGADPNGGPKNPRNNIAVFVNRVNKVTEPLGWHVIATRGDSGPRYRLIPHE